MNKGNKYDELKKASNKLNNSIQSGESINKIFDDSSAIDDIIMTMLKKCVSYEKMLKLKEKDEIINLIKNDILDNTLDISIDDLETISNTIYLVSCLRAYNVSINDILEYAQFTSSNGIKTITEKEIGDKQYQFYIDLYKKYLKIIKTMIR